MGLFQQVPGNGTRDEPVNWPIPTFADVQAAALRLKGAAHRTPVLTSRSLNAALGAEVFFKPENLQRMGAFKFRGAYNALSLLSESARAKGVVAYSSGNHAQAVALSARMLGCRATIVMPHDASAAKLAATQGYGATVVGYDRYQEDPAHIAQDIAEREGLSFIPPFDHPHVLAGQGTCALELFEDVGPLDTLFVCVGGGGLISGCALAAHGLSPQCEVIGVEPEAGNDVQMSLRQGVRVKIETPKTIADGAQSRQVGEYPFAIIQRLVSDIHTVSDEQLRQAMRWYAQRMKLVVEPTGCLSLAAVKQAAEGVNRLKGQRVGVIISGGNVDMGRYAQLLSS
ncbi:MAG: L-threonine dehydratase catabolic TdcB [Pseudomonadota bacterium]|jgi:threonine dehydratase